MIPVENLIYWGVLFASASVVLQTVWALDRANWRTHHGVRCAYLGLALSSAYALLDLLYSRDLPTHALAAVLVAISIFLAVDRRRHCTQEKRYGRRATDASGKGGDP